MSFWFPYPFGGRSSYYPQFNPFFPFDRDLEEFVDPDFIPVRPIERRQRQQRQQQQIADGTGGKTISGANSGNQVATTNSETKEKETKQQSGSGAVQPRRERDQRGLGVFPPFFGTSSVVPFDSGMDIDIGMKVNETDTNLTVVATLPPNMSKDNLKLQYKDGVLSLTVQKDQEHQDGAHYTKSSQFIQRSLRVPQNIDEQTIKAKFDNDKNALVIQAAKLGEPKTDQILIE